MVKCLLGRTVTGSELAALGYINGLFLAGRFMEETIPRIRYLLTIYESCQNLPVPVPVVRAHRRRNFPCISCFGSGSEKVKLFNTELQ
jgi:hypothetical protein